MTHLTDPIGAVNSGTLTAQNFSQLGLTAGEWITLLALKQVAEGAGGGVAPYQVSAEPTLANSFPSAPNLSWFDTDDWHYEKRGGQWYRYPQGDPLPSS